MCTRRSDNIEFDFWIQCVRQEIEGYLENDRLTEEDYYDLYLINFSIKEAANELIYRADPEQVGAYNL